MSTHVTRIATLLVSGVAIGVTFGAVVFGSLPLWLGAAVIIAVSIVTICSSK